MLLRRIYDKLVTKCNAIDTSELVKKLTTTKKLKKLKAKYPAMINLLLLLVFINQQKEILITKPDIDDFIKKRYFDTKLRNINNQVTSKKTEEKRKM